MMGTVLVVDNGHADRLTLESILENDGYHIETIEYGAKVLEKVKNLLPDVILLDVMTPGMTGFEMCEKIRSDPLVAEIPILFLIALDDRESLLNALKAGADDFITKPFDLPELHARLFGITSLNRYQRLLQEQAKLQQVHSQLLKAYEATIEGWSHAMDLRDEETEGHSHRVSELTVKLAKEFGMTDEEIIQIRRGALLHDVGKLSVPDHILHKPEPLTDEEWDVMRKHPHLAFEMLDSIEYLRPALDIPLYHHEKWDGSGYSRRLKNDEIPIAARLFAVVDVWDALTSNRPYRSAWTKEAALKYIREQSGKHFDPKVVEVFLRVVK